MYFVRYKLNEDRRGRVFPPPDPGDDYFNGICLICDCSLGSSSPVAEGLGGVQLVAVGPMPDDSEAQDKFLRGCWINAGAVLVHELCVLLLSYEDVELFVSQLAVSSE